MFSDLLTSPMGQTAIVPFAVGLIATLLLATTGIGRRVAALGIGAGFLVGYYLLQSGVPSFPPPQVIQKVFYVVAIGLALGVLLDLAGLTRIGGHVFAFLVPIAALWWLRQNQIAAGPGIVLIVTLVVLFAVSVIVYWRQAASARGSDLLGNSSVALFPAIQVLVAAIGLGGITILSFSPATGTLAMALAAATGGHLLICYLVHFLARRAPDYGATGAFGAGGAWLVLLYAAIFAADAPVHYVLIGVVALAFVADLVARPIALAAPVGTGSFARLVRPVIYGIVVGITPAAALAYAWFVLGWRVG